MLRRILLWARKLHRLAAPGPAAGDGLLLEDGTSYLLLESSDFLLLE